MIITIDGPAGTGKSTLSELLAKRLGFQCLHTGSIYRWITHHVLERGISCDDAQAITAITKHLDFLNIDHSRTHTPHVSNHVARVGKHPDVRACVRVVQNEIANTGNVVVEGRDIGTVVFPQAECKFFLTANIDVRAERRYKEYVKKGIDCTIEGVREALIARDIEDESREHSPLLKAKDAIEIDTSTYTIEEELDMMEAEVKKHYV